MILEILGRTPIWVWPLFLLLLYLGYTQTRTRPVPAARLAVLPVLMPGLSMFGMLSVFGAVAVALAMNPSLPQLALFTVAVSVAYGLPSGFFIGRALNIWRSAKPAPAAA